MRKQKWQVYIIVAISDLQKACNMGFENECNCIAVVFEKTGSSIKVNVMQQKGQKEGWVRANYLDASTIIKILVDEDNSSPVKEYFDNNNCFRMTSLCFAEALGVLKAKYFNRNEITQKGYLNRACLLVGWLRSRRILLDEVDLSNPKIFEEVESIIKKHSLDISDAFQLVTIMRGKYKNFSGESQSLFITADKDLAKAPRSEGIKVWECLHEPVL